ncbi:MAG: hypothetical protein ACM3H8_13395 [Sphingobacteriales bacterium]
MKEHLFIFILFICVIGCTRRPVVNKDLLVTKICNSFQDDNIIEPDSIKVIRIFKKHLDPYLQGVSQDSAEALTTFVYYRLQRECLVFKDISDRLGDGLKKSDWRGVDIEPESEINEEGYNTFFKFKEFKYLEPNGDTSTVHITDSTWVDHFIDGTYSRLSLSKINQNEFVITFIESNNRIRKNFSKPGERYRYKILKRDKNNYLMFVQAVGSQIKSLFKLYY